jgi:hypothetical protein
MGNAWNEQNVCPSLGMWRSEWAKHGRHAQDPTTTIHLEDRPRVDNTSNSREMWFEVYVYPCSAFGCPYSYRDRLPSIRAHQIIDLKTRTAILITSMDDPSLAPPKGEKWHY